MTDPSREDARARELAASLVGTTIDGRYQVDRVLATGSMGTVYLGRHLKLKKRVALKVLHPGVNDHPELVMRFEREALAGAQMSHPNVAGATDFGDLDDGTRYLVMEYVKGAHLRELIDREAPLEPERALRIARQMAVALDHIHSRGMVHRDMKPRNVMLETGDFVKIVDFGLAKIDGARLSTFPADEAEEDSRLTARGTIFGTVEYLAPEAAFGMELVDCRADLYALGVIIYEMISGKHPFDGKTEAEIFAKQRHAPPPPMAKRSPGVAVSRDVEAIVAKLLEKDFDERFQTAAELIEALDEAVPSASIAPPEPVEVIEEKASERDNDSDNDNDDDNDRPALERALPAPPPEAARSSAWIYLLVGGVCVAGLVWLVWGAGSSTQAPKEPTEPSSMPAPARLPSAPLPTEPMSPSAAPSVTASTSASGLQGTAPPDLATADRIKTELEKNLHDSRFDEAAANMIELAKADPKVSCDSQNHRMITDALIAFLRQKAASGNQAWRALALTECGPDRLYRFVENGGKADWALKAAELLRDEEVFGHASPAVQVAFGLRDAPCDKKLGLIDKAVSDGDERALTVLDVVVRLCVHDPRTLDQAIQKLHARLPPKKN